MQTPLSEQQILELRAMLKAGYSQFGCAIRFGLTTSIMRQIINDLNLNTKSKLDYQKKKRRLRKTDFHLKDEPLADVHVVSVGIRDRYLERLQEIHGEQGKGNHP